MTHYNITPGTRPPRRMVFLVLAAGLTFAAGLQAQGDPQVPLQRGDPQRTGRTPYECPRTPKPVWTYSTNNGCSATPVVAQDGTIYVGALDKYLYAVGATGASAWRIQSNAAIKSSAGIGQDGSIYFGTSLGTVYARLPDGSAKWASPFTTPGSQSTVGSVLVGGDGRIYFASENKSIYSVSPDGDLIWSYSLAVTPKYGMAASPSGSVLYTPASDGSVYALNSSGTFRWKSPNVNANNICAVGDDGTVYVGGSDYKLYAINPNGTVKWYYTTTGKVSTGAAVGLDGTIYVGSQDRRMYALRPDGTMKWSYTAQEAIYSAPTVDPFGTVVFGAGSGDLIALNAGDGSTVWSFHLGASIYTSPVVARDGAVYVMDSGGVLSAFAGPVTPEPSSFAGLSVAMMVWWAAWRRRR